jgi:PIN domain nuclease of toxin-antitoxin system
MLLLDTHVLIWLDEGNSRLGEIALQKIIQSLSSSQLGVATISFWEVAMLIEKQRLVMQTELDVWRSELLKTGLIEIPLRGSTAIRAGQFRMFNVDPADRMIVATAIENGATLMTADTKILSWSLFHQKIDARL